MPSVEVLFTDNVVFNGPGDDLGVSESGVLDVVAVKFNNVTLERDSAFTGDTTPTQGFDVNVATFDLLEFGLAQGASVTSVRLLGGFERVGTVSAYTVAGAINITAPWPGAVIGIGACRAARRRRA